MAFRLLPPVALGGSGEDTEVFQLQTWIVFCEDNGLVTLAPAEVSPVLPLVTANLPEH